MTDYQLGPQSKRWQKSLVRLMYFFFGLVSKVEARRLPDTDLYFRQNGFVTKDRKAFYGGLIHSVIYVKPAAGVKSQAARDEGVTSRP